LSRRVAKVDTFVKHLTTRAHAYTIANETYISFADDGGDLLATKTSQGFKLRLLFRTIEN
jgi:hypothetical protein